VVAVTQQPTANIVALRIRPSNYLALSLLNLICCCFPLGLAALIYSMRVWSCCSLYIGYISYSTQYVLCIIFLTSSKEYVPCACTNSFMRITKIVRHHNVNPSWPWWCYAKRNNSISRLVKVSMMMAYCMCVVMNNFQTDNIHSYIFVTISFNSSKLKFHL